MHLARKALQEAEADVRRAIVPEANEADEEAQEAVSEPAAVQEVVQPTRNLGAWTRRPVVGQTQAAGAPIAVRGPLSRWIVPRCRRSQR
jgi:hypothetical protein